MTIDIGCPKCGCVSATAPPNSTHQTFTTEKPNESEIENYIERNVTCPDCKKPEFKRITHDFTVYWSLRGL